MRNSFMEFRRVLATAGLVASAALTACSTESLLEANDPDLVKPADVNSAAGAEAMRTGALKRFRDVTGGDNGNGNESTWLFGGLLADEWGTASTFVQNDEVDQRLTSLSNGTVTYAFRKLNRVRTAVNQAIPLMRLYRPTEVTQVAELFLAKAFAEMQLASDFCNGIPVSDAATADGSIVYGMPLTVDSVFRMAATTADSGIALATSTDTYTLEVLYALRVTKARALLGIDQKAAAGALVTQALAPTTFAYNHTFGSASGSNAIWGQPFSGRRYLVGDSVEGNARNIRVFNAIPFFSAGDPRVPAGFTIKIVSGKPDTTKSQDGLTLSRTLGAGTAGILPVYDQFTTVTVASGLDARLIEAEAQLAAGNVNGANGMIPILNALRGLRFQIGTVLSPVMAQTLADQGSAAANADLLFREKAFWTFSRGQRLGDMRRLIRFYGRAANGSTVFPVGVHYRGGNYGADLNLPVPQEEQNNPNFKQCTNRSA